MSLSKNVNLVDGFARFADKDNGFQMSNRGLVRWFTDAGLISTNLTTQAVDLTFYTVKKKNETNIRVHEIDLAVSHLARDYAKDVGGTPREAAGKMKVILAVATKKGHNVTKFQKVVKESRVPYEYADSQQKESSSLGGSNQSEDVTELDEQITEVIDSQPSAEPGEGGSQKPPVQQQQPNALLQRNKDEREPERQLERSLPGPSTRPKQLKPKVTPGGGKAGSI